MALHRTGICPLIERGQCVDFSDSRDKHDDARIERRRVDASLSEALEALREFTEAAIHMTHGRSNGISACDRWNKALAAARAILAKHGGGRE
jgi:hypothetical protein